MRTKILFVMPNFAGGGAERVALTLLAGIDRTAFEPHLAVLDTRGPLRALLGADVTLHDLRQPRLRKALPAILRLIRRERPAVVFATQGYLNIALLAVRAFMPRGTRLALRESSTPSLSLPNRPRPRLMARAYRLFYPRADLVLCQHRQTEREMAADYAVPAARIASLPNPVAAGALRKMALPAERHPGPGLRFAAAGRLSAEKGFDRLIELCAELPADAHLTIYGEGGERAALSRLIETLKLTERVSLAGFTDRLPAALAGADACIVSSHWEGLPNVALEALAVGTPVIATPESGGIAELAEAAPAGAVAVVAWGPAFRDRMAACVPRQPGDPGGDPGGDPAGRLAPSLLPPRYAAENVAATFNGWLRKLAGKADVLYEGQP